MADSIGTTLSLEGDRRRKSGSTEDQPVLILALECSRLPARSARWSLGGVGAVHLGRGRERECQRHEGAGGRELTVRVPDRWMSSRHARLEHSFGRWVLLDTDSKNGTVVNGVAVRRAVLNDGDVFELGHTLFVFRDGVPLTQDDPRDLDLEHASTGVVGLDTLMPGYARELDKLRQVAVSEIPVLIAGESGTGKEVLARAVHAISGRSGDFVAVNCGAIPPNLVESELFGHRKGAFSGALDNRTGLVRSADHGTLFLDEIGDLPASSQAALLRVLQEREVVPVGATKPMPVDLRVVAATHRDLDELVARGTFRHDLFARLAGFRIAALPLRERRDDLGLLIGSLYERIRPGGQGLDVEAARLLFTYPWPLNIRELEQALATASVLAKDDPIAAEHLPEAVRTGKAPLPGDANTAAHRESTRQLSEADQALRAELLAQLSEHNGNVSAIARAMGKDRKQIQRWLKRFYLDAGAYRDD